MPTETRVVSFVLRFVYEQASGDPDGPAENWRGTIHHVQSDDERHFSRWADAVGFVAEFIRLEAHEEGRGGSAPEQGSP